MRTYGRNEDYIYNLKVINDFESHGDYSQEDTRDERKRKLDPCNEYKIYYAMKTSRRYCDFCFDKVGLAFNRFDIFLRNNDIMINNHYDNRFHLNLLSKYEFGSSDDLPCWCNNIPQFSRSSVGGSKYLLSAQPYTLDADDLIFESRFESGNLARVVKITQNYYELYLRPDMYTNRHTQWFYFRVKNTRTKIPYR